MATLVSSLRMVVCSLKEKPRIEKMDNELCETKPLAPTSMVLHMAFHPFDFASSTKFTYFSLFFSFHILIFSSAGEVSSTKQTFLADSLYTQMSGLELAILGGTWYCFCLVSNSIFQSVASPQYDERGFFVARLTGWPCFTNSCSTPRVEGSEERGLALLTLIHLHITCKRESCLQLILPWSKLTLQEPMMCCSVQFFHFQRAQEALLCFPHLLRLEGSGRVF